MTTFVAVAVSVALPVTIAVAIVLLLKEPLFNLLVELCGNQARARFWAMFSVVFMVLCTLYGVMAFLPLSDEWFVAGHGVMALTLTSLRAGLIGLLLSLLAVAVILFQAITKYEEGSGPRPAAR